jgi:hypothetical protein
MISKYLTKGKWLVTLPDKSKWVLDLDNMLFDNYKWYKEVGTLESELEDIENFKKGSWKRLIK